MRILADEKILFVREAFSGLGEVITTAGRAIDGAAVDGAAALVVRTITRVDERLLRGTDVRFVATASTGEDHVDKAYLAEQGIGFASAPGCNANAVAEYVVAALLTLAERLDFDLPEKSLGIVGVGNVGSRVLAKAVALGMPCVLNDPPLHRQTGDPRYRPIEEILGCDIVSLHVPLTYEGPDATHHLVDEQLLSRMKSGSILINTSRGPVADSKATAGALASGHLRTCALDVWEDEPAIDTELLQKTAIGTAHIAGYSIEGKVNATRQVYEAASRFFAAGPEWDPTPLLPPPACPEVMVGAGHANTQAAIRQAVRAVYDIEQDDGSLREILNMSEAARGPYFDRLRNEYAFRREFSGTRATVDPPNPNLASCLAGLGFQCKKA